MFLYLHSLVVIFSLLISIFYIEHLNYYSRSFINHLEWLHEAIQQEYSVTSYNSATTSNQSRVLWLNCYILLDHWNSCLCSQGQGCESQVTKSHPITCHLRMPCVPCWLRRFSPVGQYV